MDDILSQDEVDALLQGVKEGEVDTEQESTTPEEVQPFDLTSQAQIIHSSLPGLESINERFSKIQKVSISNFINQIIKITPENQKFVKYGEFMQFIPVPSSINIVELKPLPGKALVVFEAALVFAVLEFFFGNNSISEIKTENRPFTAFEQRVIVRLLDICLKDYKNAWEPIYEITPVVIGSETNPNYVNILNSSDLVIKSTFNIEFGEFVGKFHIVLPNVMIEPVKEQLNSGGLGSTSSTDDRQWMQKLINNLHKIAVEISVEIDRAELTVRDILNLQTGDVIALGKSMNDEFVLKVEGVEKFLCLPGFHRGSQAVKITRPIETYPLERSENNG
jgi:flagellar motor switch protein FliM